MDITKIIGMEDGHDGCFFKIIAEQGRGKTKYWPSIGPDGEHISILGPKGYDYYLANKVERERETIRVTVSGNAVCAQEAIKNILGCNCLACSSAYVDIYPQEVIING